MTKSFKIVKNLSNKERKGVMEDARKQLVKLNAQRAVGSAIESPGKIRALRKTIARILMLEAAPVAKTEADKGGQK
jgi:ribosomal protein L29